MNKKVNIPKPGAGRRLAARLKELGKQPPPKDLMDILNQTEKPKSEKPKKVAKPRGPQQDMDR